MSTFHRFNPLQGTRVGQPSYLGRNLYEAENQQRTHKAGNLYPLGATNVQHGNHAQAKGCKACFGHPSKCHGGDVNNPCPADQYK